jgi:diphosphomevalonate decarboxylase
MATAVANSNIALIKYWGNRDDALRIPANGSISLNLDGVYTHTKVMFDAALSEDHLTLAGRPAFEAARQRVSAFLDLVRRMSGVKSFARVVSENNFPTGAGIASSASAFAALALASSRAAGLELDERELSRLARRGSGSACRSIPSGYVEWQAGESDETSFAFSLCPAEHWQLTDCIAIVSQTHKPIGSTQGHLLAHTSPLQAARLVDAPRRLDLCRRAILERDFEAFADIVEVDSTLMHAVMMTSSPPLFYWQPATLAILQAVQSWRQNGIPACSTIDAGPNVHVLCPAAAATQVIALLHEIPGVQQVLSAEVGGGTRLVEW